MASNTTARILVVPGFLVALLAACGGGSSTGPSTQLPAALELMTGDQQIGGAGASLPAPVVVRVTDASAKVIKGVSVDVTVASGDGQVSAPTYTTDYSGRVFIVWTMGTHLRDTNKLEIRVGSLPPVVASARNEVPANVRLLAVGAPLAAPPGQALPSPIVIQVTVPDGRPLVGAPMHWRIQWANSEWAACPCGSFTLQDSVTDASGLARAEFTMGQDPRGALLITSRVLSIAEVGRAIKSVQMPVYWTVPRLFASIESGWDHSCGLTAAGAAYCWGSNDAGPSNDGGAVGNTSGLYPENPLPVDGAHVFTQLALGAYHTCGLTAAHELYCWGDNLTAEYGDGTHTSRPSPTLIATAQQFVSIAAGYRETCGLTADGTAYCWGRNTEGTIGDGTTIERMTPTAVAGGLHFASIVPMSMHAVCALTADGQAYCWGSNSTGRLGDGTTVDHSTPQPVSGGLRFAQLSAGTNHTCGLTADGRAHCWGDNGNGQLGDGSVLPHLVPMPVAGGITFQSLASGLPAFFSCGVSISGAAYCWGDNYSHVLGIGTLTEPTLPVCHGPGFNSYCSLTPVRPLGSLVFTRMTANLFSVCGETIAAGAYCWGDDSIGQNGDGFHALFNETPALVATPSATAVAGRSTGGARVPVQRAGDDRSARGRIRLGPP